MPKPIQFRPVQHGLLETAPKPCLNRLTIVLEAVVRPQRDDDEERRTRDQNQYTFRGFIDNETGRRLLKEVDAADVKAALIARHEAVVEEICRE